MMSSMNVSFNGSKMLQDKKEQMQATYDQDEMMYRERSVGNCRYANVSNENKTNSIGNV